VKNSSSTVDARYHAIAAGLAPDALAELWGAVLFGRPVRDGLKGATAELNALRDEVGRQSARRGAT